MLTALHHGAPHQSYPDQHGVDDVRVTFVTNRQRNSARAHRFLPLAGRGREDLGAARLALRVAVFRIGTLRTDDKNGNVDVGGLGRGVLVVVAVVRHFILTRAASKDMPKIREVLSLAHYFKYLSDEEFILLYDINKPRNPDIPCGGEHFDIDDLCDDECQTNFRFYRNDIYRLTEVLDLPDEIQCYNGLLVDKVEAMAMYLKRFAYPCRYADMVPLFSRPIPQICMITNNIMDHIYNRWRHLLSDLNQTWLSRANLQMFADAVHRRGAALQNCWEFVDGTVRPISRPGRNQRVLYNGHKKIHGIKFQCVAAPNGLVANLYGPVEGKRHDSSMLMMSGLLNQLQQYSYNPRGDMLCIYGDPAYPLRPQLQAPFKGVRLTPDQEAWNYAMSKVRVEVEWVFGDVTSYFKFLDFKRNLKIGLSAVGKMYIVCTLMLNAHTCLYGSNSSDYFDVNPPALEDYFL